MLIYKCLAIPPAVVSAWRYSSVAPQSPASGFPPPATDNNYILQ